MLQQAAALAERVRRDVRGDLEGQICQAYRLLYGREPTARQLQLARDFFAPAGDCLTTQEELWRQYAQVLLLTNEFIFVD